MIYSENNNYSGFRSRLKVDLKHATDHIPESSDNYKKVWSPDIRLKPYHSRWYDAKQDVSFNLRPCPPPQKILDMPYPEV